MPAKAPQEKPMAHIDLELPENYVEFLTAYHEWKGEGDVNSFIRKAIEVEIQGELDELGGFAWERAHKFAKTYNLEKLVPNLK